MAYQNIITAFLTTLALVTCLNQGRSQSLTDIEGNRYRTVVIGNQEWMAENLRVTRYADGEKLLKVPENDDWGKLAIQNQAYTYFNNDSAQYASTHGVLYSWNGATRGNSSNTRVQGICPTGWRVPTDKDWEQLLELVNRKFGPLEKVGAKNQLHYVSIHGAGQYLKAKEGWDSGPAGTDDFGLALKLTGARTEHGDDNVLGFIAGYWWSSTSVDRENALVRFAIFTDSNFHKDSFHKNGGLSVRCMREVP